MTEFPTPEDQAQIRKVMQASQTFLETDTFREFVSSRPVSLGMSALFAQLVEVWPSLLELDDDWIELFEAVMLLTIVCWEDQPLKAPK